MANSPNSNLFNLQQYRYLFIAYLLFSSFACCTSPEIIDKKLNSNFNVDSYFMSSDLKENHLSLLDLEKDQPILVTNKPSENTFLNEINSVSQSQPEIIIENYPGFYETVLEGFSVIILAEIGDKTFFLVMIYSTDNNALITLAMASTVMLSWNCICLLVGSAIPVLFFKGLFDIIGMVIFLVFGITMIYRAYHMDDELMHKGINETRIEFRKSLSLRRDRPSSNTFDTDVIKEPLLQYNNKLESTIKDEEEDEFVDDGGFHSKWAFASSLAIAEFGDKTQISSIIMGSTQNFYAVLIGTSLARVGGITIAIIFGKIISHNVTHKQVTYISGFIFLFFAFIYLFKMF